MRNILEISRFLDGLVGVTSSILVLVLTTVFMYKSKTKTDILMMKNDGEEIEEALRKVKIVYRDVDNKHDTEQKSILNIMIENVGELREYYVISKQQARKSFSASLFICFLGIILYLLGIVAYIIFDKNISVISVIGGTVVEVISGLFFWLYREATKQLSVYHQRLGSTEKYLIVIQLIKEMPEESQISAYNRLMESILLDNREIVGHEK